MGANNNNIIYDDSSNIRIAAVVACLSGWQSSKLASAVKVNGRCPNHKTTDYDAVVKKINNFLKKSPIYKNVPPDTQFI
jgi:hypothetical protein